MQSSKDKLCFVWKCPYVASVLEAFFKNYALNKGCQLFTILWRHDSTVFSPPLLLANNHRKNNVTCVNSSFATVLLIFLFQIKKGKVNLAHCLWKFRFIINWLLGKVQWWGEAVQHSRRQQSNNTKEKKKEQGPLFLPCSVSRLSPPMEGVSSTHTFSLPSLLRHLNF